MKITLRRTIKYKVYFLELDLKGLVVFINLSDGVDISPYTIMSFFSGPKQLDISKVQPLLLRQVFNKI